jgi:hypothetical protein
MNPKTPDVKCIVTLTHAQLMKDVLREILWWSSWRFTTIVVVSFNPGHFTPVPRRRLGGNQSPSGHFLKDNLLPLPVFELRLLCLAARSLVTILTELPQTHVFCLYSSLSVVNLIQTTPFALTYLRQGFTRTLLLTSSATKDLNNAFSGVDC